MVTSGTAGRAASSSAPLVRVSYAYLETLHANVRLAADSLAACSTLSKLEFGQNTQVTDAYTDYLNDWSDHREKLQEGLEATALGCMGMLEGFKEVEGELVRSLSGETSE